MKIWVSSSDLSASRIASSFLSAMRVVTFGVHLGEWQSGRISSVDLGWVPKLQLESGGGICGGFIGGLHSGSLGGWDC